MLITSRLDYCNTLLYGRTDKNFVRLQQVQNAGARFIVRVPKYASVTPVLRDLHWLPVWERAIFKVLVLDSELSKTVGQCMCDLVSLHKPTRSL